ncbi:MAG: YihY/virulence factor BrkB family protein [Sulfurimonadaceae bacterium]
MNKEEIVQKPLKKIISWLDSFFNDDTTYYAASLSFFTIFSILPIIALVISVISNLPQFENYVEIFVQYIFEMINPTHSKQFVTQIMGFISNSNKLGYLGTIYMLFVFTMFFKDYEYIVNKIHEAKRKSIYTSFFFYLGMMIAMPILFAIYILTLSIFDNSLFDFLITFLYAWLIFFFLFKFTVNKTIDNKAAFISSLITLIALSITKNLFVYYVIYNKTYTTLYGSLATLLFFFLWIYISWIIYLYGVKLCHNLNLKWTNNQ